MDREIDRLPAALVHVFEQQRHVEAGVSLHCSEDNTPQSEQSQERKIAARCNVAYDGAAVSKRPVFLPKLGAFLVALREAKGWNQLQAADIATAEKLPLGYQALRWLEDGKIKNPEPELIRGLASLYSCPYDTLIAMFVEERYGTTAVSDLPRHATDQTSNPHHQGGFTDVPASGSLASRLVELEQRVRDQDALISEVSDVARHLFRRLALGEEGGPARVAQPTRRGRGGKTRRRPA